MSCCSWESLHDYTQPTCTMQPFEARFDAWTSHLIFSGLCLVVCSASVSKLSQLFHILMNYGETVTQTVNVTSADPHAGFFTGTYSITFLQPAEFTFVVYKISVSFFVISLFCKQLHCFFFRNKNHFSLSSVMKRFYWFSFCLQKWFL